MPRGPAPQWSRRKEPILDDHLRASVTQANGVHDPDTGHYAVIHYTGCGTRERAKEIKQALHRSARHVGVSVSTEIVKAGDGTFTVKYRAIHKSFARKYMIDHYGPDTANWPYRPRERNTPSA